MATPERLRELAAAPDPRAGLTNLFFVSPGEGVTDLLLIRHAQIEATMLDDDLHLTEIGREQAEVLAEYLSREKIDAIYASPTARATETAEPIARAHALSIETVPDLRDIEQLRPFDRPFAELLAEEYGQEAVQDRLDAMRRGMRFDMMAPFLESSASFRGRIQGAIEGIIARHSGQRVAVVSHGPVIMCYVASIIDSPRDFLINPKLTSITRVLAKDDYRTLDYMNARPHFEAG